MLIPGRVCERQNGTAQADAIDLSMKPSLQRFAGLVQRELDARRTAVDRQDGWHGFPFVHCFAHVLVSISEL